VRSPVGFGGFPCAGRSQEDGELPVLMRRIRKLSIRIGRILGTQSRHAFGSLDWPWKPRHLRSAYGAICCHRFKPKNMTDDIFLAQILGHKLLPGAAALSVGQSYKDFFVVGE
jgi:hypothetical protein